MGCVGRLAIDPYIEPKMNRKRDDDDVPGEAVEESRALEIAQEEASYGYQAFPQDEDPLDQDAPEGDSFAAKSAAGEVVYLG